MAAETSFTSTHRFRQRKINLKQHLRIIKEANLPDNVEDVRGELLGIVDTGVDKSEEDERHLQAVLNASSTSAVSLKPVQAYIPTPEASKKWSDYSQFYVANWVEPESYIRSSATVNDAQGTDYNMDETDEEFLEKMNSDIKDPKQKCTEDEFEMICDIFEKTVAEKQPFLATDPGQLMPYEELETHIHAFLEHQKASLRNPMSQERLLIDANSPDYVPKLTGSPYRSQAASFKLFGANIYNNWRERKIASKGKSIFPALRYETGLPSDESDPYVCFRHREVRHSRKTRRTDQQNSGRIRKLHSEMQSAMSIVGLVLKRERSRLQQIQSDFEIFEMRCRVKALKRKLKIGPESDDAKLMVSDSKRARQEHQAALRREANEREKRAKAAQDKLDRERERRENARDSSRSATANAATAAGQAADRKAAAAASAGCRIPDLEHVTVEQQALEKSIALEKAISDKLQQRSEADKGWVNVSDNFQLPAIDFFRDWVPLTPASDDEEEDPEEAHKALFEKAVPDPKSFSNHHDKLTALDYSSVELNCKAALNWEQYLDPKLELPLNTLEMAMLDSPEVMMLGNKGRVFKYGELDFQRDPGAFAVPRDSGVPMQCRKRRFGGVEYIDRILPKSLNPQSQFRNKLAAGPNTEMDERLLDRFKFDTEYEDQTELASMLCDDPAKLNSIEPATQNLRFSSMLTAKSIELINEASFQRRRVVQAMQKRQQQQLQQRANAEAQAQRNAQVQSQANLRMQQAQRTMERQQQKKQKTTTVVNRNTDVKGSELPNGLNKPGSEPDTKSSTNGFRKPSPTNSSSSLASNGTNVSDENTGTLTPQIPKVEAGG